MMKGSSSSSSSFNPEVALTSGKTGDDDLQDILQLMERVKSKRERLKRISSRHTSTLNTPPLRQPIRPSTFNGPFTSTSTSSSSSSLSYSHQRSLAVPPTRPPIHPRNSMTTETKQAPSTNKVHRIFQDVMQDDDDDDEMEKGRKEDHETEFVDEELDIDAVVINASQRQQANKRQSWMIRVITVLIMTTTLLVVFVVTLGMRQAEKKAMIDRMSTAPALEDDENSTITQDSNSTIVATKICFETSDELSTAITEYLKNPNPDSPTSQQYGYPIGTWCVSKIQNFNRVFSYRGNDFPHLYQEFNEPLDGWDMSSAVYLQDMFYGAKAFNQDISMWNVSSVKDVRGCFCNCESFNQDLSKWDMRSVTVAQSMFENAKSFQGIGIGNWTMPHLSSMDRMFQGASVFNGAIGTWNVSAVTSMLDTFRDATLFNQDLHQWRLSSQLHQISALFQGCTAFNGRLDGWNLGETKVSSLERVFSGASSFNQPLNSWDVTKIERFDKTFRGAISFNQDLDTWTTKWAYNFDEMFSGAASFDGDITTWDMQGAEIVKEMFQGATSFNQPIGVWNFSKVTDMSFMFASALSFDQDLSAWNVGTVQKMSGMFGNAAVFNGDIQSWDVSQVQTMDLMFRDALLFNQDISSWNMTSVKEMGGILVGASNFNQSLCSWANTLRLPSSTTTDNNMEQDAFATDDSPLNDLFDSRHAPVPHKERLFADSGCTNPGTPQYSEGHFLGPFCHPCSISTPLP